MKSGILGKTPEVTKGCSSTNGEHPEDISHIALCPPQLHATVSAEQCSISPVNRVEG